MLAAHDAGHFVAAYFVYTLAQEIVWGGGECSHSRTARTLKQTPKLRPHGALTIFE